MHSNRLAVDSLPPQSLISCFDHSHNTEQQISLHVDQYHSLASAFQAMP